MRAWLAVASLACCIVLLSTSMASADVPNPGSPQYANKILSDFETSVIKPGETAVVSFNVSNPYPANETMRSISLTVGVYMYATQEKSELLTKGFPEPPLIEGVTTEKATYLGSLDSPDLSITVSIPFVTSRDTPHGSYFSQSTYFVRFSLTFNFDGNETPVVLKSRGYFTDDEWDRMVSWESGEPIVDTEYMKSLGVDGLIPDTSFGIKAPIPRWPLAVIIGIAAGLTLLGGFYHAIENPGKYPRLEKRFYYLRGKLRELRGQAKNGRRK